MAVGGGLSGSHSDRQRWDQITSHTTAAAAVASSTRSGARLAQAQSQGVAGKSRAAATATSGERRPRRRPPGSLAGRRSGRSFIVPLDIVASYNEGAKPGATRAGWGRRADDLL
jgi:hypothetical protein